MNKTQQIFWGVVAFLVVFLVLLPLLPSAYSIHFIATVILVVAAIVWVLNLAGANPFQ